MIFVVRNTYKYTATVEVEADSEMDALTKALGLDDEPLNDDWLYDSTAKMVEREADKKSAR